MGNVVPFGEATASKLGLTDSVLPPLLSVEEVAEYLGLGTTTVREMVRLGELPAYKIRRRVRISAEDVRRLLDASREEGV